MTVAGIIKSSLVDYPGLVSCVLFVPGCNYNCYYCHNRELLDGSAETISGTDITGFLEKRRGLLDGVVISGGEPTLQPDLIEYIGVLKDLGYKVKLDTNGSSPHVIGRLLEYGGCDYFAVDYKAPAARYNEICRGVADAGQVVKTIKLLLDASAEFEVRTTVIPELGSAELLSMAAELPRVPKYALNRYRKPEKYLPGDKGLIDATALSPDMIAKALRKLKVYQPGIVI